MRFLLPVTVFITVAAHAAGLDTDIVEFQADRRDLSNSPAVSWSPGARGREDALLTAWENRLAALDYDSLDATARIDWHLLHTSLQERRDELLLQGTRFQEIQRLLAFSQPLLELTAALAGRQLAEPRKSAEILSRAGAGWTVPQRDLSPDSLAQMLGVILSDPADMARRAAAAHALAVPDATRKLADMVEALAQTSGRRDAS